MKVLIREYRESDKQLLEGLIEELMDFVVATDPMQRIRRLDGYGPAATNKLLKIVGEQDGQIFFAEVNGDPVGYVAGFPTQQTEDNLLEVLPTKLGVIEDLFVKEKFRTMNVGTALITKMEEFLKEKGCDSLWVEVFTPNTVAHNYYKHYGFMDREVGMLKQLK